MKAFMTVAAAVLFCAAPASGFAEDDDGKLPGRPGPAAAVSIRITVIDYSTLSAVANARISCRCDRARQMEITNAEGDAEIHLIVPDNNDVRKERVRCTVQKTGYRDSRVDAGHLRDGERVIRTVRLRQSV